MTRDVITISAGESCRWALLVMNAAGIGHLPVCEGDRLVGVVSERDIYRRAPKLVAAPSEGLRHEVLLAHVNIGGVMTYGPVTVAPSASLAEAVSLMLERGVGSLPVLSEGRLVGILTIRDILRGVFGTRSEAADCESAERRLQ